MRIEIRAIDYVDNSGTRPGEELLIDGRWVCRKPGRMDGNQVAHSIAFELRRQGIEATYQYLTKDNS